MLSAAGLYILAMSQRRCRSSIAESADVTHF
jgi:hypothetical protein